MENDSFWSHKRPSEDFKTLTKSSIFNSPFPVVSNSFISALNSSSDIFSYKSLATFFKFLRLIVPVLSSSNNLKAFIYSSSGSLFNIFSVASSLNYAKVIVEPSVE